MIDRCKQILEAVRRPLNVCGTENRYVVLPITGQLAILNYYTDADVHPNGLRFEGHGLAPRRPGFKVLGKPSAITVRRTGAIQDGVMVFWQKFVWTNRVSFASGHLGFSCTIL